MTLTRILCPIDFSEASSHALEHAAVLCTRTGARLTALHVFMPMLALADAAALAPATFDAVAAADLQSRRERADAQCRPVREAGVALDVVVTVGQPVPAILDHATALPADLIVMGTHGTSGFEHLVLGSVTEKVLRKAACPVLTVPPRVHAGAVAPPTHVLCAVDFSDCSQKAAVAAAGLAAEAGARLTLLHVIEWPWHEPPTPLIDGVPATQAATLVDYHRYLEAGAVERLKALAASSAGVREAATRVRFGKAYAETLAVAEADGADLIVLGVRGRSALDIGFFGSTANHVVRAAACPVLTVRV